MHKPNPISGRKIRSKAGSCRATTGRSRGRVRVHDSRLGSAGCDEGTPLYHLSRRVVKVSAYVPIHKSLRMFAFTNACASVVRPMCYAVLCCAVPCDLRAVLCCASVSCAVLCDLRAVLCCAMLCSAICSPSSAIHDLLCSDICWLCSDICCLCSDNCCAATR